ncbi:hypothetical protein CAL7716_072590 [Calothrix sp. PCC 7716]|nr:hypothetical protein CAL7716_072590 [Calothrix sp. PCC 7716]
MRNSNIDEAFDLDEDELFNDDDSVLKDGYDFDESDKEVEFLDERFLAKYVFTDGGKDFRSKHLVEWISDQLGFEPILRSHPSEGGIVERPFRTMSGLLSEMPGFTGANIKERPEGAEEKACITLPELEKLILGYIVDNYNQKLDSQSQANPFKAKPN